MRRNIAEIDEIIATEHVVRVRLTPAERAVYLELDHHLQARVVVALSMVHLGQTGQLKDSGQMKCSCPVVKQC